MSAKRERGESAVFRAMDVEKLLVWSRECDGVIMGVVVGGNDSVGWKNR